MITFILGLFVKGKTVLMAIVFFAISLLGLKFYSGTKKKRKNERKLAIHEGKQKVSDKHDEIDKKTEAELKEIDDENSDGVFDRLNNPKS